jgi:hypothetical protein
MGKNRRKIPLFRINFPSGMYYQQISQLPGVKEVIINELIIAIKEGVNKKKESISLFSLADENYYINIEKKEWNSSLQTALIYYEKYEMYDKCIECRDLLNKISYESTKRTNQHNKENY